MNTKEIQEMIRGFVTPAADYFAECMLQANTGNGSYAGGIFICDKSNVSRYGGLSAFWVRSFYALAENMPIGKLFTHSANVVNVQEMSVAEFSKIYFSLLNEYTPDSIFLESQAFPQSSTNVRERSFDRAFGILDGKILSAAAVSDGDYVSYFLLPSQ